MTADAIPAQNSLNTSVATAGRVDNALPQESTHTRDESTFAQTNNRPVPSEKKLPTFVFKRLLTAGLCGVTGAGFIFGTVVSCTVLGGIAGVVLGLAAATQGNRLLKRAILTLIGVLKEPNKPNYVTDFDTEMFARIGDFEKYYPIPHTIFIVIVAAFVIAAFISFMALGGIHGIILGLALNTIACGVPFFLNDLLKHDPKIFDYQQQFS